MMKTVIWHRSRPLVALLSLLAQKQAVFATQHGNCASKEPVMRRIILVAALLILMAPALPVYGASITVKDSASTCRQAQVSLTITSISTSADSSSIFDYDWETIDQKCDSWLRIRAWAKCSIRAASWRTWRQAKGLTLREFMLKNLNKYKSMTAMAKAMDVTPARIRIDMARAGRCRGPQVRRGEQRQSGATHRKLCRRRNLANLTLSSFAAHQIFCSTLSRISRWRRPAKCQRAAGTILRAASARLIKAVDSPGPALNLH